MLKQLHFSILLSHRCTAICETDGLIADHNGRNSPWVRVNVFGEFPQASFNTLLSPDDVQSAITRHLQTDQYDWSQKRLGVDVARFGDDLTVIFPRQGLAAFRPVAMSHARDSAVSTDIASR